MLMSNPEINKLIKDLVIQKQLLEEELIRKRAFEEEVAEYVQNMNQAEELALDVIAVLNKDRSIKYINGPVKRIFGKHSENLIGSDFVELVHPNNKDAFKKYFNRLIQSSGISQTSQLAVKSADDSKKLMGFVSRKIESDTGEYQVLLNMRGISGIMDSKNDKTKADYSWMVSAKELKVYNEQLRKASIKQDMIIENERFQIAREIHDELGQMLTILKMDVFLLKEKIKAELNEESINAYRDDMQNIFSCFDSLIKSVQNITQKLRPDVLNDLGLVDALRWLCEEFENTNGIKCEFINKAAKLEELTIEYKNVFFRIVQQALNNVIEHAEATRAVIELSYNSEFLHLNITDNGKGIKEDKLRHPNSLGLLSMRERSHYLGGEFSMSGDPEKGSEVSLKIPVSEILFKN